MLSHPRLRGLQALGDAFDRQAGVEQSLVSAGTGDRVQVPAQVVLDQRFDQQVCVLVVVAGARRGG